MAVIAQDQITLTDLTDVAASTTYYYSQTSTLAAPSKPTVKSPTGWTTTEPTVDTTKSLYTSVRTDWSNGEFTWSDVSLSSSYEAAKAAYNKATTAQATADTAAAAASANSTDLTNYITSNTTELSQMQSQIDGSIATWFYEVAPTADNAPTKDWTTTDLKNNHLGDLYYDTITGYCYRYQVVNNVYSWSRITDTDVTKALSDAAKAQDTADNKRRVFVTTPTPPYDIGDQWVQGSAGDILICSTAKTNGQTYVASDWTKASKYTDDTKANAAQSTADSAKSTAEGIQVGGTNLLTGASSKNSMSNKTFVHRQLLLYDFTKLVPGEQYTISFLGTMASDQTNWYLSYHDALSQKELALANNIFTNDVSGKWSATFTMPQNSNPDFLALYAIPFIDSHANNVTTANVQLERGNKPTDWSPAPEDVESGIATAQNAATNAIPFISGTQTASTSSFTGVAPFSSLVDGQQITYWLPYAQATTAATLNLTLSDGSTTGAKNVYYGGASRLTGQYMAGSIIQMAYRSAATVSGSSVGAGWWCKANYVDGNDVTNQTYNGNPKIKTAVSADRLVVGDSSGYFMLTASCSFDVTLPILLTTSSYSAGASTTYGSFWVKRYNIYASSNYSSWSGTNGAAVFVKGVLAGTTFTADAGDFLTCTTATSDDGCTYIKLGTCMYTGNTTSTAYIALESEHPMFRYSGSSFKSLAQIAAEAASAAASAIDSAGSAQTAANNAQDSADKAASAANTAQSTADAAAKAAETANTNLGTLSDTTSGLQKNVELLNSSSTKWNALSEHVRVGTESIVIEAPIASGQSADDVLSLVLTGSRISFVKGTDEVAYVSGDKLYITSGVFVTSLRIGNFEFVPRSNGNMSFKKVN